MSACPDITGKTFGKWTVLYRDRNLINAVRWVCRDDQGTVQVLTPDDLESIDPRQSNGQKHEVIDLENQKFTRLTVQRRYGSDNGGRATWLCQCKCGNVVVVSGDALRRGHTQSCGCLRRDKQLESHLSHGMAGSKPYAVWNTMKARCLNPNHKYYKYYGGRGIACCERWLHSFENFWEDMGPTYTEGLTIERKDVNGNYEPDNCIWATYKQQQRNRRNNVLISSPFGRQCIAELAEITGMKYTLLRDRVLSNKPTETLFAPPRKQEPIYPGAYVNWNKVYKKWEVRMYEGGKKKWLGRFSDRDAAVHVCIDALIGKGIVSESDGERLRAEKIKPPKPPKTEGETPT